MVRRENPWNETKYFPRSKPLCRVSDPANHHTLCRRSDPPLSICFACKDHHLKINRYYYYCSTCDLEFHRGCHLLPPKVSHPFHLHHSLTLSSSDPSFHSSNNLLIGILYPPVQKSQISISDGNHVKCKYC
ncbi:hypothetical protein HID58_069766 [Brassica napus]|uniref:DC1 domain-containing protein n=1 Tax=Brassica napus TaxID=3708 RepID=A0ABQ7YWU3_BRANA|nr:hypothetical protein HID58_069766 [Brassica napus]